MQKSELVSTNPKSSFSTGNGDPSAADVRRASLELVGAGALWGFGFVATVWALSSFTPLKITVLRFAIAALVGGVICLFSKEMRASLNWKQALLALGPGFMISLTLILQTWGLYTTTATKSSFITTLYVLIVPIIESLVYRRRLSKKHWFFVGLALVGVALICDLRSSLSGLVIGDWLTLGCSIAASIHIVWIGAVQNRIQSSFGFNTLQSFWAFVFPLICLLAFEPLGFAAPNGFALGGLLSLAIGSTLIGFALQVRAQKVISPALASLLFLLESPFAAVFAMALLNERLHLDQWIGAVLILGAVALSVRLEAGTPDARAQV